MKTPQKKVRMGDALIEENVISREQLHQALIDQKDSGRPLGEVLVDQGVVTNSVLVSVVARRLGVKGCVLRPGLVDPELIHLIGEEEAERLMALPMFKIHNTLTVAMSEPQSPPKTDRLRELTGCRIRPILVLEANVREMIRQYARGESDVNSFLASLSATDVELIKTDIANENDSADDVTRLIDGSPIVNLVNMVLLTAIKDGASDIHIEPDRKITRIRYRIDGTLRELMSPPAGLHAAITSRVKVIGNMDIAEKRLPQEGRVRIVAEDRSVDLRISSMPTVLGEKLVIRVLDKANLSVRLEDLGFRPQTLAAFLRMLNQPHGLVLVTGPTGSGKTTTLYSALELIRNPELNIVTVEDPVEYQLDTINQIQVQESIGMTFARALRSILRQDPDIIMVGEIRDRETARIAVQAALTGHLVLATLHTNDAPGAVARLIDMKVEPYLLSSALNGVVAQRLARTICPSCVTKYTPSPTVLADAGIAADDQRTYLKGAGCQQCHDSGFRGRLGIYEVMEIDAQLRRMVHAGAASHELRAKLDQQGSLSLRQEGVMLALEGKTCLEEVLAVTHSTEMLEDESLVETEVVDAEVVA
ncbi:MAG: Flp pilus assembly complex ATPase component TadA [Planctomycetes bacterium]|nr:Flp pilus assembly complex ATPase component TadA [Planctomycetota bacterium]